MEGTVSAFVVGISMAVVSAFVHVSLENCDFFLYAHANTDNLIRFHL